MSRNRLLLPVKDGSVDMAALFDDTFYLLLASVVLVTVGVVIALSRDVYRQSLRTFAIRSNLSDEKMGKTDQIFRSSMKAEEDVERVLREEGWDYVFLRRRVAVSRVGHNREIDVIAVGPVVLVVEVKNWQGYVWSNGPRWFQRSNPRGRQTLEFEDVQEDNVEKAAALRRYIENSRRIALPDFVPSTSSPVTATADEPEPSGAGVNTSSPTSPGATATAGVAGTWYSDRSLHKQCGRCIVPVVVFTNRRVLLDPATVKAKKHVFTMETFRTFARETLRGNVAVAGEDNSSWLSFLAPQPMMQLLRRVLVNVGLTHLPARLPMTLSEETQDEVATAVDVLRTWDMVYLHDGSLITGDVQKVDAPNAHLMYERKHLLDINLYCNSGVMGLVKTLLTNKSGEVELILTTAKRLAVKKRERKPRNSQGNMVFPLLPKRSNPNLNDRLVIRPAGTTRLETFALVDLKEVRLSHHLYEAERQL